MAEEGWVKDVPGIINQATMFYKQLFGNYGDKGKPCLVSIDESLWREGDKLTKKDKEFLCAEVTEQEVWKQLKI